MELQTMPLKFRVWNPVTNEFVSLRTIYADDGASIDDTIELEWADLGWLWVMRWPYRKELVFSQDTGFKDKNGKSIFTMDLVKCWDEHIGQVYYDDALLEIRVKFDDGDDEDLASCEPEVVANIWQNPELLEEK